MKKAISVNNLFVSYGNRQVLSDISFEVKAGHIHGLLGPNGAGKTTTMKTIIGLIHPKSGEVFIQGNLRGHKNRIQSFSVGYLLESPPLYEDLSVYEYLYYLGELHGMSGKVLVDRLTEVLILLDIEDIQKRRVGNLSKGYKQRVGIAQAIIHAPDIVVLDEPTLGLDPQTVLEIRKLILKLKDNHTVLISSHQLHEMSLICDEVSILVKGEVVDSGTISKIGEKLNSMHEVELDILGESESFSKELEKEEWIQTVQKSPLESVDNLVEKLVITPAHSEEIRPRLINFAVKHDMQVVGLHDKKVSLEELFINLTGDK